MIHPQCLTRQWLEHHGAAMNCRSLGLLEKTIIALQLTGHLAESGLPFQFKGANPEAFHYWHRAQRILRGDGPHS